MIHELRIQGFKRFFSETFELEPLTVLAGMNGAGKTSLIQALLLSREACRPDARTVRLEGPFGLQLGSAEEVLNWNAEGPIKVALKHKGGTSAWQFAVPDDDALYLDIVTRTEDIPIAFAAQARTLTYLNAERLGPRTFLRALPVQEQELEVGVQGEFCAHVLSSMGNKAIEDTNRIHPSHANSRRTLLKYVVEDWLSEIARPVEIDAVRAVGSSVAELHFRPPDEQSWVRAPNMGFGVSYALPVVLGGLIAEPGGLLIVENPEAHLHPAGQSRMGSFLAWLAGRGVQVLLETHSDHILNGIRRAIAEFDYLHPDLAVVQFFGRVEAKSRTPGSVSDVSAHAQSLRFTANGSVSDWPKGFFDQFQIDVSSLGRLRRKQS